MRKIVVEEDRVLRLIQVILDPSASLERVAAFADFNSTDPPDFGAWLTDMRAMLPALYPAQIQLVGSQEELREHLPTSDVAIVESLRVGADELALAPKLTLVQNFGAVADNVDAPACERKGVAARTLRRRTNIAMGEHTMMLVLALAKRLSLINGLVTVDRLAAAGYAYRPYDGRHTAKANFGRIPDLRTLHGTTLGLLGFGEIGRETAMLARAFGMRVLYHKRHRLQAAQEAALGVGYCTFDELFASSDYLSVHVPMSEETRDLVGEAALSRMRPGAYLVNTSRAEIVNQAALLAALRSGRLAGAGLDVLPKEPAPEDEPLLDFDNVIVTPHLGGASRRNGLDDAREMLLEIESHLQGSTRPAR
ncbi:MAG TPA: NAD(P)-dependent oxidoreductase [Burkholderiales bacterium]|jgi:phosphoglycerate dehydrogenase-like enzyme|nr:NAD(P)-dependent oxidoreductase [Burkholderiales bacterium]